METPILPNETPLKDSAANLHSGIAMVGGRLHLTNQRLVFEPDGFSTQGPTVIPLSSIDGMRKCWTKVLKLIPVFPNSIAVSTKEGREYRFVVFPDRQAWIEAIQAASRVSMMPTAEVRNTSGERVSMIEVSNEIDRFFEDSSKRAVGQPEFVLILGPICCGKTTFRKQLFSTGYVLIDAGEIFLSLSNGEYFEFGQAFEEPMELIGSMVAKRAIQERRNIVTEMIGDQDFQEVFDAMTAINYKVQLRYLECDMEERLRRNLSRGDDNISAAYTQAYHQRWILNAVKELA